MDYSLNVHSEPGDGMEEYQYIRQHVQLQQPKGVS